jgi:hypothetical protein
MTPPLLFDLAGKRVYVVGHTGMAGSAIALAPQVRRWPRSSIWWTCSSKAVEMAKSPHGSSPSISDRPLPLVTPTPPAVPARLFLRNEAIGDLRNGAMGRRNLCWHATWRRCGRPGEPGGGARVVGTRRRAGYRRRRNRPHGLHLADAIIRADWALPRASRG